MVQILVYIVLAYFRREAVSVSYRNSGRASAGKETAVQRDLITDVFLRVHM